MQYGKLMPKSLVSVNNDVEAIDPEWLTEMVSHTIRPDVGCVGAKLFYSNDTIQHGGVPIGIWGGCRTCPQVLSEIKLRLRR